MAKKKQQRIYGCKHEGARPREVHRHGVDGKNYSVNLCDACAKKITDDWEKATAMDVAGLGE